jgi:hypothetical protein
VPKLCTQLAWDGACREGMTYSPAVIGLIMQSVHRQHGSCVNKGWERSRVRSPPATGGAELNAVPCCSVRCCGRLRLFVWFNVCLHVLLNFVSHCIGGLGFLLHKNQSPSPRVGLGPKPNFFHFCRKAQALALIKPDLFSKFFKPKKAQAQSMKPEPNPSPKKSGPTHLYMTPCDTVWIDPNFSCMVSYATAQHEFSLFV